MILYVDSCGIVSFIPPTKVSLGPVVSAIDGDLVFTMVMDLEEIKSYKPENKYFQTKLLETVYG